VGVDGVGVEYFDFYHLAQIDVEGFEGELGFVELDGGSRPSLLCG
jgi:hypothetical protein